MATKNKHLKSHSLTTLQRGKPAREQRFKILIVCEGQNTEPSYFEQFKVATAVIEIVGTGRNTLSLVDYAEHLHQTKYQNFNQVWCVFDADPKGDNPSQLINFKKAIQKAANLKYEVAYSNQAFEYWLILHFENHQGGGMDRKDYQDKINRFIKPLVYDGKKSKIIEKAFFERLTEVVEYEKEQPITREDKAIQRAKSILQYHEIQNTPPERAESSTTVFKLVELLRKYR
jgi:hypothetical protein